MSKRFYFFVIFILSIFVVAGCTQSESNIEEVFNGLFINEDLTKVDSDLSFPKSVNGVEIIYDSNKPEIISNDGRVSPQDEDQTVEITIILKDGKTQIIKKVSIIVIKKENKLASVFDSLFFNVNLLNVTEDLIFPKTIDGVELTYVSNEPSVISNEGKVSQGDLDQEVKITITLKYNNEVLSQEVIFLVLKKPTSKIQTVGHNLLKDIDLNMIVSNLELPTLIDGVSLVWSSTESSVISSDGIINRSHTDKSAILHVTLTYGAEVLNKSYNITVLKDNNLFIARVYDSLFTFDLTKVTNNLDFITFKDGVIISYQSSNENAISNTGVITRSSENIQVTINVSLTYQTTTVNKELVITIIKTEIINYPIIAAINASTNQSVTVQGIVIGYFGDNAYIHDGSFGIYLYKIGSGYKLGDEIRTTGTKTEYNGLIQLQDTKNTLKLNSNVKMPDANNIENLNEIKKQSTLYNIADLTITKFDNIKSGADVFITVTDSSNNTMQIIISKHTDSSSVSGISSKLGDIAVGDKITLTNIVSGYYKKYQLALFSANQITIKHIKDEPIVTKPIDPYYPDSEEMSFLQEELDKELTSGLTPKGQANVLIIPINFTDYIISNEDLARISLSFFGTSEETGWESVQSYYYKSSLGKFNFSGRVLNPYQTNKPSTYYANRYNNGYDADYDIIKAVLQYYDDIIDYSDYDNNNDGYIDGLYFIYAAPTWYGYETGSVNESDLWWAYVYQYYTEYEELYDGVEANYYLWAGVDFMDEAFTYTDRTDYFIDINSSTYIHETGHMLGLYDYYDYEENKGPDGGLGGADMMDDTVGDHNSFTKIILDWVTPLVVSGKSTTVTINSFTESGNVILVSTNWNNSYFDEYFLIELYTTTGLNESQAGFKGLYSISGIRIFHVNAQINPKQEDGELFLFNNSNTSLKILKPIEADNDNSIEILGIAENEDLFQMGDVFGMATNYRLANGSLVNFNIKILNLTNNNAQIEITFN